ncbi:NINE protein [Vannielia sp.]|uniref:TM2 domain-containing protein n=1 Tax=Vannielia sp. TaxID=2813045 RepID=UPI0026063737|nr:NINE protein [Vannielia sp.]MDF1871358.1 NINE protein [Vannielia sp.]
MRGEILTYDAQTARGLISGEDGQRYEFAGTDVKDRFNLIRPGMPVDFQADNGLARSIYPVGVMTGASPEKEKLVAGLLALFLGGLGVHKFYLGYTGAGVAMLCLSVFGIILLAIPTLIIAVIAMVEAILYLTKTDEDFQQIYVDGKRPWF